MSATADIAAVPRELSPARRALRRLVRRRGALVGLAIIACFVLLAIAAPYVAPDDPLKTNFLLVRKPPSVMHLFGTDEIGRDVLSRVIWGARASLLAGVVSVSISLAIGVPVGMAAGYIGGWVDMLISRVTDAMLACPFLILAIALAAFLGPSLTNAMIAIGIVYAPTFARIARGPTLAVIGLPYIEAARAIGASNATIIVRHVLPNVSAPLLVQTTVSLSTAILTEAALSFLGLGTQPPTASWGLMLSTARQYMLIDPWIAVLPGIAIAVTVLGFNLLGDGLRDVLDPRIRTL